MTYSSGSTFETTISASQSFAQGTKVGLEISDGTAGDSVGLNMSFQTSKNSSESMTITETVNDSYRVIAPCHDGIDHDRDEIWVQLGPVLDIDISQPEGCTTCDQQDGVLAKFVPGSGATHRLLVGHLRGTIPMPDNIAEALAAHELTSEDLGWILAADPMAAWPGDSLEAPEPGRFVRVEINMPGGTIPYSFQPDKPSRQTHSVSNQNVMKRAQERTEGYEVAFKLTSGAPAFGGLLSAKISVELTWKWTQSNADSISSTELHSASVTMGNPSSDYKGPASIAVYYDTMYQTFAFGGVR